MPGERSSLTELDDDRCELLRWKGMNIEAEWDPTAPHSGDRAFWCHLTQQCLGPDGIQVDDFQCNPARTGYNPLRRVYKPSLMSRSAHIFTTVCRIFTTVR